MTNDHDTQRLNAMLDLLPTPKPVDNAFISSVLDAALPRPVTAPKGRSVPSFTWRDILPPLGGLALACTLGVLMGLSSMGRVSDDLLYLDAGDYIAGSTPLIEDLENLK